MTTNDINNERRAPRNYRLSTNEKINNEMDKKDNTTDTNKTEEKKSFQVHVPEGPNTHNVRQYNNQSHPNETNESNPKIEKKNLSHSIKHRKKSHRSGHSKAKSIIRPIQPSNQAKPNLSYLPQSSTNQSHFQQRQTITNQQSNQHFQSSTNQSQKTTNQ